MATKVAVVTGGSRGIGRSICERLAGDGFALALVSTNADKAGTVAAEIAAAKGVEAVGFGCDVGDPSQVDAMVEAVTKRFGRVDALVNNAGVTRDGLILRMKQDDWDAVLRTNLTGAFNTCRAVSRTMLRQRGGSIVNISSVVGLTGNAGQANYAASKAGLHGLTKSIAKELAGKGVRCNALAPGYIRTDMTEGLSEDVKTEIQGRIPMGRLGEGDDIAGVVSFLCSEAARYVTGQVLAVDGGMVM